MREIYSGAAFVIAAHDSASSTSGFLQKRRFDMPKSFPRIKTVYWMIDNDPEYLQTSALSKRGWTLQEILLATRILHFTDAEMIWECNTHLRCESGNPKYHRVREVTRLLTCPERMQLPPVPVDYDTTDINILDFLRKKDQQSIHWTWRRIVEEYSKRSISRAVDTFVALSGMAQVLSSRLHVDPKVSYLAGLWRPSFIQDMLWITTNPASTQGGGGYIAPSWSWASVPGPVAYFFFAEFQFKFEENAHVSRAHCEPRHLDPTAAITSGFIEITGQHQHVILYVKSISPGPTKSKGRSYNFASSRISKPKGRGHSTIDGRMSKSKAKATIILTGGYRNTRRSYAKRETPTFSKSC